MALKKLHARDCFSSEIRRLLLAHGFEEAVIANVLQFLNERRVLDDQRTLERTVERYSGKRSAGKEKIKAELLKRGLPEEEIEASLAGLPEEGELEKALAALGGRMKASSSRAKGARFLFSRGFSEEVIEQALERFFGPAELHE